MSITMVLHDATRTSAPRVGGFIAGALRKHESVRVIVLKDGPLVPWIREMVGADGLHVVADGSFSNAVAFADRVKKAEALLQDDKHELVYVNSVAASVFVAAAKALGRGAILHVYEKASELRDLLRLEATKPEIVGLTDGFVLAADRLAADLAQVFQTAGERVLKFGMAVDALTLRSLARQPVPPPVNCAGRTWEPSNRIAVGMCGTASLAKGADIFVETAAQGPEFDFIWIGGWRPPDAPDNPVHEDFEKLALPNYFITGATDNPYGHIQALSVFLLSSREDPNPLVLAEAAILGIPILAFSATTTVTDWLGRAAILCYGTPNPADIVRVLRALDPGDVRRQEFIPSPAEITAKFDLDCRCDELRQFIASVRAETKIGKRT
jgi:glycosyltransferase involved in cell wall biosynthesis